MGTLIVDLDDAAWIAYLESKTRISGALFLYSLLFHKAHGFGIYCPASNEPYPSILIDLCLVIKD